MLLNTALLYLTLALSQPYSPEIIVTRASAMGYHKTTYKRALVLSHATHEASLLFGVPQAIIMAVIERETAYQPDQISTASCRGPTQLMPKTFRILKKALGMPKADIDNSETNILFGTYYLSILYQKYGEWGPTLTAYNRGPGRFTRDRHHRVNEYSLKVIDRAKRIEKAEQWYLQIGPKCSRYQYQEAGPEPETNSCETQKPNTCPP